MSESNKSSSKSKEETSTKVDNVDKKYQEPRYYSNYGPNGGFTGPQGIRGDLGPRGPN